MPQTVGESKKGLYSGQRKVCSTCRVVEGNNNQETDLSFTSNIHDPLISDTAWSDILSMFHLKHVTQASPLPLSHWIDKP